MMPIPHFLTQVLATSAAPAAGASAKASEQLSKPVIFATSGLGGVLGWLIVHPANTLAVRSNLASMHGKKFSFSGMVKEQGLMSVYDGVSAGRCGWA